MPRVSRWPPVSSEPGAGAPGGPVVVVGTTASGKSDLSLSVARRLGGVEILSADSMCVYRAMDIGTAKPSPTARTEVPHHLIDLVDPSEEFTVRDYQVAARRVLADVGARGAVPLLVGGTGLYVRAVVDDLSLPGRFPHVAAALEVEADRPGGVRALHDRLVEVDPVAASRTTDTNRRRIVRALEVTIGSGRPFSTFGPGLTTYPPTPSTLFGIPFAPQEVDRRIAERFHRWVEEGLVDEVAGLAARPGGLSRTARQALGYRELLAHVEDGAPLATCVEEAIRRTRGYARRQWAWFRRDPRVRWLASSEDPVAAVASALGRTVSPAHLRDW